VGVIANHSNLNGNAGLLAVALAHGFTIAVMVSATGGISGGHLNPAVTFGLLVAANRFKAFSCVLGLATCRRNYRRGDGRMAPRQCRGIRQGTGFQGTPAIAKAKLVCRA